MQDDGHSSESEYNDAPEDFKCSFSLSIFRDPVINEMGQTYERANIESWYQMGKKLDPLTNRELKTKKLYSNTAMQQRIKEWKAQRKAKKGKQPSAIKPVASQSKSAEDLKAKKQLEKAFDLLDLHDLGPTDTSDPAPRKEDDILGLHETGDLADESNDEISEGERRSRKVPRKKKKKKGKKKRRNRWVKNPREGKRKPKPTIQELLEKDEALHPSKKSDIVVSANDPGKKESCTRPGCNNIFVEREGKRPSVCTACFKARYCSPACQQLDFERHYERKGECDVWCRASAKNEALDPSPPPADVPMLFPGPPPWAREVMPLIHEAKKNGVGDSEMVRLLEWLHPQYKMQRVFDERLRYLEIKCGKAPGGKSAKRSLAEHRKLFSSAGISFRMTQSKIPKAHRKHTRLDFNEVYSLFQKSGGGSEAFFEDYKNEWDGFLPGKCDNCEKLCMAECECGAHYCSKKCQTEDWKTHKPEHLEVVESQASRLITKLNGYYWKARGEAQ